MRKTDDRDDRDCHAALARSGFRSSRSYCTRTAPRQLFVPSPPIFPQCSAQYRRIRGSNTRQFAFHSRESALRWMTEYSIESIVTRYAGHRRAAMHAHSPAPQVVDR